MRDRLVLFIFIAVAVLFSGCVTMPDPIDELYLKEKTEQDTAKLDKIEADIIAKKKSQDIVEKDAEIAAQKADLSGKEVLQTKAGIAVLLDKEKLYTTTKDNKLQDVQKEIEKSNLKFAQLKAKQDYDIAKSNAASALLEVKKYELGVKVAELNYEKALIAKAYQMKRKKEYEKNMIDDEDYKKFLDDQKIKLEDYQKEYEKATKVVAEKEDILKKSGYEGEK
jgi:PBP1b-binding outer membrane lipoprotein LpoB